MELIGPILLIVLGFAITFSVSRWIFRIDTIADNAIYQTKLLREIARKNGVSEDDINSACRVETKKK